MGDGRSGEADLILGFGMRCDLIWVLCLGTNVMEVRCVG